MAVTKLLRLKESSRGNRAQHLKNNIRYIMNPEKTQDGRNIGGNAGITPEDVYFSMTENKKLWHKEDGSQGFHYVISFPPGAEVSMNLAHLIAQDFCEELLGEDFLYVYAIHDDKPHLHIHVTFDSVSRLTGVKFHSPHGDWEKRIQPITDRICEKYGLPPLTYDEERVGAPYETWRENRARENGEAKNPDRISWMDIIRDDIDEAVRKCDSYVAFLIYLQEQHYQVRDGKYLSLKPPGKPRAVRTRSLGVGYGKEEIIDRISLEKMKEEPFIVYGDVEAIRLIFQKKSQWNKNYHLTPFQRQFYHRWRRTCFIRRPGFRDSWKYKKDVVRLQELSDHVRYVLDHDIASMEDLAARRAELETERKAAGSAFNAAKTKLYRNHMFRLLRERKKLQSKGAESPERIRQLEEMISMLMPLEEAIASFELAQEEYDQRRVQVKELRRECRLLDGIRDAAMESTEQIHAVEPGSTGHENVVKEIREPKRHI